ncbi:hypothetical protein PoB_000316800 [Plakobranchus ocellatus]|uniref:Uncharacterized protein n=1 Tax=Plakobranchus ocellatus TaxID=259542 RepID=A0AAV3Y2W0_9GAST|nr:hypothetical protein PoB_000316800 [Plakobranchus ocellatus]
MCLFEDKLNALNRLLPTVNRLASETKILWCAYRVSEGQRHWQFIAILTDDTAHDDHSQHQSHQLFTKFVTSEIGRSTHEQGKGSWYVTEWVRHCTSSSNHKKILSSIGGTEDRETILRFIRLFGRGFELCHRRPGLTESLKT